MKVLRSIPKVAALVTAVLLAGCQEDAPSTPLAPTASALAAAKPKTADARTFSIDKSSSKVDFLMEAPFEKIRGRLTGAAEGDLAIDLMDITKATGLVAVDLTGLELFQTKADEDGGLGEETKSDLQNQHARTWLEISPDTPEDMRKKNARVELSITKIEATGDANVAKQTGKTRKTTFKATGDFLLHGRKTTKNVDLEATFTYEGEQPVSVTIKTTKPFAVGLEEHDVKPREAFGRLALKTLGDLAPKVGKEAMVTLELTAVAKK
jgi:polyisoprenoid-binding protein YceI